MKQLVSVVIFIISALYTSAQTREPYSEDVRNALINGAKAKVTIKVVDEEGKPVTNAVAGAFFRMTYGENPGDTIEGVTDNNGLFTAEGKTTDIVFISAKKDGYYLGRNKFHASKEKKLDGDKWLPWDVTNTVVMRKIKNPVPMYVGTYECTIPVDTYVGFDCEKTDLLPPYGKGETADFNMMVKAPEGSRAERKRILFLSALTNNAGFMVKKQYVNSEFKTEFNAPYDGYNKELVSTNVCQINQYRGAYNRDEYIIFKSRVVFDEKGIEISANYGKFFDKFDFTWLTRDLNKAKIKFTYYFNPVANDYNLEYDRMNNLIKNKRSRYHKHRSEP